MLRHGRCFAFVCSSGHNRDRNVLALGIQGLSALCREDCGKEGVEYRNNHHILGVGYYHAPAHRWHLHPWNEYREDRGYYWSGEWHEEPDQRPTTPTLPSAAEIKRVNVEWRRADPDKMQLFWGRVDRFGFGGATDRQEGS